LAELKSNFVSSVSHELRAPIASVRLLAESLERNTVTEEAKRRDYFQLIGRECRRLSALVENVLDFSRIDQGRKRYEFEPTNLSALVRETIRLMEPYAAERQVSLAVDAPTEDLEITVDGRALQQALVNLIDNALKHAPPDTSVLIELNRLETTICLSVSDEGPGIPTEDHRRIFEPFFRRGSELRRETQGAGIGLSIVRHVVLAHHGQVNVESAPGRGARFALILPIRPQSEHS
jgi:signal transduction histidine kinase